MTANELAVELEHYLKGEEYDRLVWEIPDLLRKQQAEIERLIGAEPITYGMLTFCKNCGEQNPYPAKTLTDEEIIEVFESPFHPNTTGKINDEVIAFARAILKKAQEK